MAQIFADTITLLTDPIATDGILEQPGIAFAVSAEQANIGSGSSLDGRYHAGSKQLHGLAHPKAQDTFVTGTSGRTGRAFNVVSGTWKTDSASFWTNTYRLQMTAPASGTGAFEVVSNDTTPTIEACEILLELGTVLAGITPSKNNCATYLHFAYGNKYDYRLAFVWAQPIRMDYTTDGGNTWALGVAIARELGNLESYLKRQNNELRIRATPDKNEGIMWVEIGDGNPLTHAPSMDGVPANQSLPNPGKIRLVGQNRSWAALEYYPLRHDPPTMTRAMADPGRDISNLGDAYVVVNGRGAIDPDQQVDTAVQTDGKKVGFTAQAALPDAGDGLGSADAPRIIDSTLIIPPVFSFGLENIIDSAPPTLLRNARTEHLEVLDDASRTLTSSAMIIAPNYDGIYTGAVGHRAIQMSASIGGPYYPRFSGLAGVGDQGLHTSGGNGWDTFGVPCEDPSFKMKVPIDGTVDLNGWCKFGAAWWVASAIGGVHPQYMQTIPFWPPGPAGSDCPFPILDRGNGLHGPYEFLPGWTPWGILQLLVSEWGEIDPLTNNSTPYYMGFTPDKQLHIEPYDPTTLSPTMVYSDFDPGLGRILAIDVYNSVAQLRTDITIQGIDARTYELLQLHLALPDAILRLIGFRYPMLERNARYATQDYIEQVGNNALRLASLPTRVVRIKVPFCPWVHASQVVIVIDAKRLGGAMVGYITECLSVHGQRDVTGGSADRDAFQVLTIRDTLNF